MNRLFLLLFGALTCAAHAQVPDYVPTEGLVAWYPFNGNADDESGNEHDFTSGDYSFAEDQFNTTSGAIAFNELNSQAFTNLPNGFADTQEATYSFWWRVQGPYNYNGYNLLAFPGAPGTLDGNFMCFTIDENWYWLGCESSSSGYTATARIGYDFHIRALECATYSTMSNWNHTVVTCTANSLKLYFNGVFVGEEAVTVDFGQSTSGILSLGTQNNPSQSSLTTRIIDELGIWNRALTESEILALYNAETPGPGCTDTSACNYDVAATSDDGSCFYAEYGQDCDGNCLGGTHWYVDSNASNDVASGELENPFPNIQDALDRACPNDTIHIASGTYLENVNVTTPGLTMIGDEEFDVLQSDQTTVVVDANNAGSGLVIDAEGTHIIGLTFTNGNATHGGAVYATNNGSNSILDRCAIINNSGLDLVTSHAHNLQFEQCAVLFNSGRNTIVPWNTASFNRCRIQNNTTPDNSNAILAAGENTQIVNCLIGPNVSKGVYAYGASLLVEHTTITGHTWGCAVDASLSDAAMYLVNSVVSANDEDIIVNQSGNNLAQFHFATCMLDDSLNYSWESAYSTIEEYGTNYIQPALLEEDFSLASNSPAIGVATSELTWPGPAPHEPAIDISGAARPQPAGTAADLGAFEHPLGFPEPTFGCTDEMSCNFNPSATDDDGSCIAPTCDDPSACNYDSDPFCGGGECIPSGCMEPLACNYNALAECAGEPCDYTCCPGPGCCADGTSWDYDLEQCVSTCPEGASCPHDLDFDGVVGVGDLMNLLTMFGTYCPTIFTSGDSMN